MFFFTGLAHITLPNSTHEAWIIGGKNGLIIAADTADVSKVGHISDYPSQEETMSLQIPIADGVAPPHEVLHEGACTGVEMML